MNNPYGLILAGGGAKGAYQFGAWEAFRELKIEFSAIAGVSIGAINGALIASDNFDGALELWSSVTVGMGVNINSELKDPNNLFSRKNFGVLLREFVKNGGIDASPTKELLTDYISEQKVRNSNSRLAMVAFNLNDMTPSELFIDDIPEGQLVDYLLASAHVPGVNKIGPQGERYFDGGIYDNAPISLLRKYGYSRLIVVDISSMRGIGHKTDIANAEVVYIRPYNIDDLGAAFDFSEEMFILRRKLGYLDTMKSFGKYSGKIFYFPPDEFRELVAVYSADAVEEMERLAYEMKLERTEVFTAGEFLHQLKTAYENKRLEEKQKAEENEPKFYEAIIKKISSIRTGSEYSKAFAVLDGIVD